MFSFRRRPRTLDSTVPQLKTSPSLPELHSQGIPWPENLVDVAVIRENPTPVPERHPHQGAVKSSVSCSDRAPIPFHKPFRLIAGQPAENGSKISSLYMSHPPSAFGNWRSSTTTVSSTRRSHRKNRAPPAFNLMVVGGTGTGKTSFLRLLLETADMSPNTTEDQRVGLDRFLKGALKHTQHIDTACVEICESRYDRVLLTVIDTPGLDFGDGRELRIERQVSEIIKYLDAQYADTMNEESKVLRQSKGDQHVHLCIFMVDPSSILSPSSRPTQSPFPGKARSNTTVSSTTVGDTQEANYHQEYSRDFAMSPAELRVIRRLSARVNVLPVIAHADSLTDATLSLVKAAVHRDLESAGLDFGVFSTSKPKVDSPIPISPSDDKAATTLPQEVNGHRENGLEVHQNGSSYVANDSENKERPSRPVITLKGTRQSRSRSRSRRDLSAVVQDEREPYYPDGAEEDSVANIRFSAGVVSKTDLSTLLPFALIAPEQAITPRIRRVPPASPESNFVTREDATGPSSPVAETPVSPDSPILHKSAFTQGPPEDLRGVFTRKFRWGTVDVLNPDHCDFPALRTAILLTHLKVNNLLTFSRYILGKFFTKNTERRSSWLDVQPGT
ncbi:Septin-domain-containing protein [Suillus paluster]|uniref:Septin-domain-containing protein n=1 Tax=Suillus paluster TaxID=48578 RepID=UPI001B871038|nr:Septin-domain-containing protein [Suillus paluster]KAG1746013.1 Septin-domain-containing protein [Suillus paluster]